MVPYAPPGWGETLLGHQDFFGCLTFEKSHFLISKFFKIIKIHQIEMGFDLLTPGKESPRKFDHFGLKIIENGQFWVEL